MKNILSRINVPMFVFCLFWLKFVITGFDVASAVASFAISGIYAYNLWQKHNAKHDVSQEILNKVQQLEGQISVVKLQQGIRTVVNDEKRRL